MIDAFRTSEYTLFHSKIVQRKKECLKVSVLHWYVGILLEVLVW